jgi:hypothetical protein
MNRIALITACLIAAGSAIAQPAPPPKIWDSMGMTECQYWQWGAQTEMQRLAVYQSRLAVCTPGGDGGACGLAMGTVSNSKLIIRGLRARANLACSKPAEPSALRDRVAKSLQR